MSLTRHTTVKCPFCDTEQDFEYYASVNVTMSPELKLLAMLGRLNAKECIHCKKEINVVSGFLYHDMEKQLMINFKTTDDESGFDESDTPDELRVEGYIFRTVFSIADMVEKILIFDSGLNDKVVSNFKMDFIKGMPDMEGVTMNFIFRKLEKSLLSTKLVFALFTHVDQMMQFKISPKKLPPPQRELLFNLDVLKNEGWLVVENYSTT